MKGNLDQVSGRGENQLSGSVVEARAGEEIPHPNSLRRWEKNGAHGAEVKGMDVAIIHLTPSIMEMSQDCERKVPGYRK